MDVSLGGIFTTRKISRDSEDAQALDLLNRELIADLGLVRGVTHAEFIKGRETSFIPHSHRGRGATSAAAKHRPAEPVRSVRE